MEMLQNFFDWFFALGSSVFVPFIMFTLCMVFKGGLTKSLQIGRASCRERVFATV